MNKNDYNMPRNFEQLYMRFKNLTIVMKNYESNSKSITKINNELDTILKTLVINVADVLDSQSDISLWFYSGIPDTTNEPYISWEDENSHEGDLYYDIETGKVYKFFVSQKWVEQIIPDLIQAMAITNAETDTSIDHMRKVFFTEQPEPPYSNGDWWINNEGTLRICQITKESGAGHHKYNKYLDNIYSDLTDNIYQYIWEKQYIDIFEPTDWIQANNYTSSLAQKIDDTIEVLKGTLTTITDNYAKFTDLSTGGSTIISGDNIKTGTIDADLVTIANNKVQLGNFGIKLGNGAQIIGADGLKGNYLFQKEDICGFEWDYQNNESKKKEIYIDFNIPDGFLVTKATITLLHSPIYWDYVNPINPDDVLYVWGVCKNVKLYKCSNINSRIMCASFGGEVWSRDDYSTFSEIENAYGDSGFSASDASMSSHDIEIAESIDIKDHILSGINRFKLETSRSNPVSISSSAELTGALQVLVNIEGFIPYE